jgi:hypothetical protein
MSWWEIILFIAVVIFALYAFASIVGFRTRTLTRPTDRTAENMYDDYADSPRKQRRYARHHGGGGPGGELGACERPAAAGRCGGESPSA